MKILYVFFHSYTDMPYHVREWVEAALKLGHEVNVITAIDPEFLKSINWDKKVKIIHVDYPGNGILNYFKLLRNFKAAIFEALNELQPEIVYERFSPISPGTTQFMQKTQIPYWVEINGIISEELKLSKASFLRRQFFQWIQKYVFKRASSIIAVTDEIKSWLHEQFKIPNAKITTIPNGVNITRFKKYPKAASREKFKLEQDAYIVGFLGSLFPWCGLEILIENATEIISRIPNIVFLIGGGQEPVKSNLIQKVKEAGLEKHFLFKGQITWEDAPEFISAFDIAIETRINTPYTSFSPLKIYAYMACGVPIICSDLPNIKNIMEQADCGFLYKDNKSFIEAIVTMHKQSHEESETMANKAREFAEKNCSWKQRVKETLEIKDET